MKTYKGKRYFVTRNFSFIQWVIMDREKDYFYQLVNPDRGCNNHIYKTRRSARVVCKRLNNART